MEEKITIYYDDQPDDIIEKVDKALETFGMGIEYAEGGDGYQTYVITEVEK